ncbi:hypothetical protein PR048_030748 [Dryococelus australis]|uniref:Uncharacterized protein n=1 Tax=Dryococelus australis TaxID=614101 RepID=A0ABQ9GA84_9NEOP|nr:hypothetical protein PR048_030748 [Dryococelus australis]
MGGVDDGSIQITTPYSKRDYAHPRCREDRPKSFSGPVVVCCLLLQPQSLTAILRRDLVPSGREGEAPWGDRRQVVATECSSLKKGSEFASVQQPMEKRPRLQDIHNCEVTADTTTIIDSIDYMIRADIADDIDAERDKTCRKVYPEHWFQNRAINGETVYSGKHLNNPGHRGRRKFELSRRLYRKATPKTARVPAKETKGAGRDGSEVSTERLRNSRGGRDIPEKTLRQAASSGTIPACKNPGATPDGNRTQFDRWEAVSWCLLTAVHSQFTQQEPVTTVQPRGNWMYSDHSQASQRGTPLHSSCDVNCQWRSVASLGETGRIPTTHRRANEEPHYTRPATSTANGEVLQAKLVLAHYCTFSVYAAGASEHQGTPLHSSCDVNCQWRSVASLGETGCIPTTHRRANKEPHYTLPATSTAKLRFQWRECKLASNRMQHGANASLPCNSSPHATARLKLLSQPTTQPAVSSHNSRWSVRSLLAKPTSGILGALRPITSSRYRRNSDGKSAIKGEHYENSLRLIATNVIFLTRENCELPRWKSSALATCLPWPPLRPTEHLKALVYATPVDDVGTLRNQNCGGLRNNQEFPRDSSTHPSNGWLMHVFLLMEGVLNISVGADDKLSHMCD